MIVKTLKKAASVILALCLCAMMPFALAENAPAPITGEIVEGGDLDIGLHVVSSFK